MVRPAWAHTGGCKSRHELATVSEVKRNCVRATERGKEAWSVNREPMNLDVKLCTLMISVIFRRLSISVLAMNL